MKISHFKVTSFSIPFVKPLKTSGMTYTHREGVWIKLKCANFTGVGEASPLSGFSTETLKEVRYALEGFHQAIEREDLDREELFLLLEIHSQNTPSVRFALETAIYDILAKEEELPLAKYLNNKANVEILVNGFQFTGNYTISWDAASNPSGIYFIRLKTPSNSDTRKIVLIK